MTDYEVGFGKPPKAWQFKPGQSGNPRGRPPKKASDPIGDVAQEVLDAPMQYGEKGRIKIISRREWAFMNLLRRALKGEVKAAALVLKKRKRALRGGQSNTQRLVIADWLPDYPGQTGHQKAQDLSLPPAGASDTPGKRGEGRGPDEKVED